jgi:putative membrane protein
MSFFRRMGHWLRLFFCGLCMGSADLVPGISGGTVAFIMGFYEPLIESLKTINVNSLKLLVTFQFKRFSKAFAWRFLVPLGCGIATAFIMLAGLFHQILGDPTYRVYLYAVFFGLVVASFIFCAKQVKVWNATRIAVLVIGAVIAHLLTSSSAVPEVPLEAHGVQSVIGWGIDWWLVVCGAIAITAMLLPGISGSYLLTLLGAYAMVIGALVDFIQALKQLQFDQEAFFVLLSLAIGIVFGLVLFVRAISWLLKHQHDLMIAALVGFMIGSLRAVWPFWSYEYVVNPLKPSKGPQLQPLDIFWPDWHSPFVWKAMAWATVGFALVFAVELLARNRKTINCFPVLNEKKLGKKGVESV